MITDPREVPNMRHGAGAGANSADDKEQVLRKIYEPPTCTAGDKVTLKRTNRWYQANGSPNTES